MKQLLSSDKSLYLLGAVLSLLLSVWLNHHAIINNDGICYIQSALAYKSHSYKVAAGLCGQARWFLYSYLIYLVASLTTFSFTTAAAVLNAIFTAITVMAFIYLTKLLGGNRRVQLIALAVILMAHELNTLRPEIIRDHGYWSCYLLSIAALIHHLKNYRLIPLLMWFVTIILAGLFRVEGFIFLLLMPIVVFFDTRISIYNRLKQFVWLNLPALLAILLLLLSYQTVIAHAGRLAEIYQQSTSGMANLANLFIHNSHLLQSALLNDYSKSDAVVLFFMLMCCWYIFTVSKYLSFTYAFVIIYGWVKKSKLPNAADSRVLWGYCLINLIITSLFLLQSMFLSQRYLIALILTMMLWIPFIIDYAWLRFESYKKALIVLLVLMLVNFLGVIIHFGHSKLYIKEAGNWVANNIAFQDAVYSNSAQVLFYAGRIDPSIFLIDEEKDKKRFLLNPHQLLSYDYLVIREKKIEFKSHSGLYERLKLPILKIVVSPEGEAVVIYRVIHKKSQGV